MIAEETALISSGVPGLDEVLGGGLPPHYVYLVQGDPGAGKTTLALQFLLEGARRGERDSTMFHPSEVELGKTIASLLDKVEQLEPSRVIVDSLAEIRLLSDSSLRYRKQIPALKQFFANREVTALLIDDRTAAAHDVRRSEGCR